MTVSKREDWNLNLVLSDLRKQVFNYLVPSLVPRTLSSRQKIWNYLLKPVDLESLSYPTWYEQIVIRQPKRIKMLSLILAHNSSNIIV